MSPTSPDAAAAAAAAATRARFDALVLPHLDRLLAFARRRTESLADAEDAVQEACVRAWIGFGELRDDVKVRPWLYRILRTALADAREKNGRRSQLVSITRLEQAHDELLGGDENAVFAEVVARLSSEVVHLALAEIPEDFAVAVELHDIDGFKYVEIAEIVGVPIGTVMSRIARGRKLLAGAVRANQGAWAAAGWAARSGTTTTTNPSRRVRPGGRS
jgi:RNA polymerase sigma-70 factor, ECF subfamily